MMVAALTSADIGVLRHVINNYYLLFQTIKLG